MRNTLILLAALLIAPILMLHAAGILAMPALSRANEVLYVSITGNDGWSGTLSEANATHSDGPLATLNKARWKVRELIAKGLTSPITVQIRGGEYKLDQTVVFGPEDSGTEKCPVTYEAYPGEKPVFTGAKRLSNWKKCTNDPNGLPEVAKGKLYYCNIPSDLKDSWRITSLYDGLTMLPRSQSQDLRTSSTEVKEDLNEQPKDLTGRFGSLHPNDLPVIFTKTFNYQEHDLRDWPSIGDVEIFIHPRHVWLINLLPLAKVDPVNKTATFTVPTTYQIKPGNRYRVENAIDYLDQAGEWIFFSKEGRVYLWPDKQIDQYDILAPYLQEFIRIEGVNDNHLAKYINFTGLTFHHGSRYTWHEGDIGLQHDWDMYDHGNAILRFRNAENCKVDQCAFTSSSGDGVRLDLHCQQITITNSLLSYLGGTGVLLSGYGAGTKDVNHHNTVSNNCIHHVGEIYWHSPGIFISQSGHNLISHNTVHDLAYDAIVTSGIRPHELLLHKPLSNRREWIGSIRIDECKPYIDLLIKQNITHWDSVDMNQLLPLLHSGENRIEYNDIYKVMLRLGDGNAIYFSGTGINNHVVGNYIHDFFPRSPSQAIRLDDCSTFAYLEKNVCINARATIGFNKVSVSEVRNNFFINVEEPYISVNVSESKILSDRNISIVGQGGLEKAVANGAESKNSKGKAANASPKAKAKEEEKEKAKGAINYQNSLLYISPTPEGMQNGDELFPPYDKNKAKVGLLFADPMFDEAAMKERIFRFKPGSPCEKLGIEPIDLSSVGSTLKE